MTRTFRLLGLALLVPAAVAAQADYRNLDDDRPSAVEDAYPLERRALELSLPWRTARADGARRDGCLFSTVTRAGETTEIPKRSGSRTEKV